MDQLGLIILGAILGAAATGGVQTWIAARQRRFDRKVAAWAILGDLSRTEALLLGVLDYERWPEALDSQRPLNTWREFRGPFAASVSGAEWLAVDNVFGNLNQIALAAALGNESVLPAKSFIQGLLAQLEKAQEIVVAHAAVSENEQHEMANIVKFEYRN